ncbi:MAG: Gfo/Idh/MocA family oxidoreductase [Verrucomicrobia bacterium]|nr:Gfo/Idh/MocA family oxidoreductase [Verrucomicrobiota bacterium]
MKTKLNRRAFLKCASFTAAAGWGINFPSFAGSISPNEKLNIGMIGVAGRAAEDLQGVSSENIVAICDVDSGKLMVAAQKHPKAATYNDFRGMIERNDLDAIVIGTPDHTHAVAAAAALKSGRHVYCEKPLTRTVSEARIVTELAREHKRVTQIGTQIHAGNNYRRTVELVQSGVVGQIREVHVWVAATYGGADAPSERPAVPAALNWDLWLGPVPYLPYSPEYAPFNWRNWWAFGGGALADFGCHYMDLPHWALGLSHPNSVEVVDGPAVHADSPPPWLIVKYEHPARGANPPVTLTWYHGGKSPALDLPPEEAAKWRSGVLFVGEKGQILADYGRNRLLPERDFEGFKRPNPFIPNSIGHHLEWIQSCKTGGPTTCAFEYSGPLTEAALLGNVAYRAGCKLDWDHEALKAKNCTRADEFIQHHYRSGWSL